MASEELRAVQKDYTTVQRMCEMGWKRVTSCRKPASRIHGNPEFANELNLFFNRFDTTPTLVCSDSLSTSLPIISTPIHTSTGNSSLLPPQWKSSRIWLSLPLSVNSKLHRTAPPHPVALPLLSLIQHLPWHWMVQRNPGISKGLFYLSQDMILDIRLLFTVSLFSPFQTVLDLQPCKCAVSWNSPLLPELRVGFHWHPS